MSIWSRSEWYRFERSKPFDGLDEIGHKCVRKSDGGTIDKITSWSTVIKRIIKTCTFVDLKDSILVEMLGTLGNMTKYDMLPNEGWAQLMKEFPFLDVLAEVMLSSARQNDLKLQVVILCGEICCDEESAELIASSKAIDAIQSLWVHCEEDAEIMLQLVRTYEKFFEFCFTRNLLLKNIGTSFPSFLEENTKFEYIYINIFQNVSILFIDDIVLKTCLWKNKTIETLGHIVAYLHSSNIILQLAAER